MSLTVVIPFRGQINDNLLNCLESLRIQTKMPRVILVNYSFKPCKNCNIIDYDEFDVAVISEKIVLTRRSPECIAVNIGIRSSSTPYVAYLNSNLILQERVIEVALTTIKQIPEAFIVSQIIDLPQNLTSKKLILPNDFSKLLELGNCTRKDTGNFSLAPRSWWYKVHGYDERIPLEKGYNTDIEMRARLDGKIPTSLDRFPGNLNCKIFYQWNRGSNELVDTVFENFLKASTFLKRFFFQPKEVLRNHKSWGGMPA